MMKILNKIILFVFLVTSMAASGDTINWVINASVNLSKDDLSSGEIVDSFSNNQDIYWGSSLEYAISDVGIGASINLNPQELAVYSSIPDYTLILYDLNTFISIHLLSAKAFLDPFLEAGVGVLGFGIKEGTGFNFGELLVTDEPGEYPIGYCFGALGLAVNFSVLRAGIKLSWQPYYFDMTEVPLAESMGTDNFKIIAFAGIHI